jgi:3-dehydroquinate synthase II
MKRSVWLKADTGEWESKKLRITAGLESGVDWVLIDDTDIAKVRELGNVKIAAFSMTSDVQVMEAEGKGNNAAVADAVIVGKKSEGDGTIELPKEISKSIDIKSVRRGGANGAYVKILSKEYETLAEKIAEVSEFTLVSGEDWKIIPLENLIARIGNETELIAGVSNSDEARTAFETLEIGSNGVLLDSDDVDEIRKTVELRDSEDREVLKLGWAKVISVESKGMADRVCVDTGSLMRPEEGMLMGSMARGLFFVHAETAESPYVASRPFRVNAGAVHAYVRSLSGKTRYLSELQSGDEVQIVSISGETREAVIGRCKIEKRPMIQIEAEIKTEETVDRIETLLQNAETVKVETRNGPKAVTSLSVGDEVLVYYENSARHFGESIEESIIEK